MEEPVQVVVQYCGGGAWVASADEDAGAESRGHGEQADCLQPDVRTGLDEVRLLCLPEEFGQCVEVATVPVSWVRLPPCAERNVYRNSRPTGIPVHLRARGAAAPVVSPGP